MILPVIAVGVIYLPAFYESHYLNVSSKRVTGFVLSIILFYFAVLLYALMKKHKTYLDALVHSSFFVYVFAVLILTGYFILFREISSGDWWDKMMHRVDTNDRVNFEALRIFKIYDKEDVQILGNLAMLFPLGMYIPLLNKKLRRVGAVFVVLLICLVSSIVIEFMQLATRFRSADVDDVILNVIGGCLGFFFYQMLRSIVEPSIVNRQS